MPPTKPKMTSAQLLEKRKEVAKLYDENKRVMEIVSATGLSWPAVNKAIKLYQAGGMEALQPKTGRTRGSGRSIPPEQEDKIKNILYTQQPRDVRINQLAGQYYTAPQEADFTKDMLPYREELLNGDSPQYLWCRDSVKELILQISGIKLSNSAINKYLSRWGFPTTKQNQRPVTRCSEAIQNWFSNHPQKSTHPKTYWLYRQRLATKEKQSKISATDHHRKEFWTVIKGNFSQELQIEFLRQLRKQTREPMTVIRYRYDHFTKKQVSEWLATTDITLLPPLLEKEKNRLKNDLDREAEVQRQISQEYFDALTEDTAKFIAEEEVDEQARKEAYEKAKEAYKIEVIQRTHYDIAERLDIAEILKNNDPSEINNNPYTRKMTELFTRTEILEFLEPNVPKISDDDNN